MNSWKLDNFLSNAVAVLSTNDFLIEFVPSTAIAHFEQYAFNIFKPTEPEKKKETFVGKILGRRKVKVIKRKFDDDMLEQLEELLIASDMGVDTAMRVAANMAQGNLGARLSTSEIKKLLADEIEQIMENVAQPLPIYPKHPQVVLVVGVNGSCLLYTSPSPRD